MNELINRLKSYEPLWEDWEIGSFVAKGASSNVFKLNRISSDNIDEYSAVKVISINAENETGFSLEAKLRCVHDKRISAENEISNMYKLNDCPYVVHCNNYCIKDIFDEHTNPVGFDVLIHMNYYTCLTNHLTDNDLILPEDEVLKLAKQVSIALKAAHDNNIIHRDIKPDNIFIDENKNYLLGDMGVSKQINNESSFYTIAGTEPYIAPEQLKVDNMNKQYKTSDIYSFGIVLYTLLNNNYLPFVDETCSLSDIQKAVKRRLSGENLPPPNSGSHELQNIVLKACKHDPRQRYQSMDELLYDLYLLTNDKELSDLQLTVTHKSNAKFKALVAASALVLAVVCICAIFFIKHNRADNRSSAATVQTTASSPVVSTTPTSTTTASSTSSTTKTTTNTSGTTTTTVQTIQQTTSIQRRSSTSTKNRTRASQMTTKQTTSTAAQTTTATKKTTAKTTAVATQNQQMVIDNKEAVDEVI